MTTELMQREKEKDKGWMRGHATCAIRLPPAVGHKAFAAHMLKLRDCGIQGKITMPIV